MESQTSLEIEEEAGHDLRGPLIANPWKRYGIVIAVYTGVTIFFMLQGIAKHLYRGQPIEWRWVFTEELLYWYLWAAFTPIITTCARRFRLERPELGRNLAVHAALSVAIGFGHTVLRFGASRWVVQDNALGEVIRWLPTIPGKLGLGALSELYKYWLILGVYMSFYYYVQYRSREREAARLSLRTVRLESQLRQAQLNALKMQLHPHFLFNTLNAVSVLMREDVSRAERMLLRLSELLRTTLEQSGAQQVQLAHELNFLRRYLDIEQIRFEDRLSVRIDVPSDTLDALVPNLILQPLVENAVKHGIAARPGPGYVEISSYRRADRLIIEVCDDGPGLPDGWQEETSKGIGLSTTRKRLEQRYGSNFSMDLTQSADGGLCVTLAVPFERDNES